MPHKPTEHETCFDETTRAIPGFATLPERNRNDLYRFIRARTYRWLADRGNEPYQIIAGVALDADLKFQHRIDRDLVQQTCRELVPRLLRAMQ